MFTTVSSGSGSFDSLSLAEAIANQRSGFGILVFTFANQLLYMNRESKDLMWRLNEAIYGQAADGVVPVEILDLCREMLTIMQRHSHPKDVEQVQLRRVIGTGKCAVYLQAVAVPHPTVFHNGRMVFIMSKVSERQEVSAKQAKEQFDLTEREQTVLFYLMEGLTNKQIAERLGIAEPTVKAHISHIMHKTKATTRTAVILKILSAMKS